MRLFPQTLISDTAGSFIRHLLSGAGGFLVAKNIASLEQSQSLIDAFIAILPGLISYSIAQSASIKNKKK